MVLRTLFAPLAGAGVKDRWERLKGLRRKSPEGKDLSAALAPQPQRQKLSPRDASRHSRAGLSVAATIRQFTNGPATSILDKPSAA